MKAGMTVKNALAGFVLASSSLFAVGASAALIPAWDWTADGGFSTTSTTCDPSLNSGDCSLSFDNINVETPSSILDTASIVSWGTGSGGGAQSALQGIFGSSVPGLRKGPHDAEAFDSGSVPIPEFEQIVTNGGWTNTGAAVHYNNVITAAGGAMNFTRLTTSFQLLTPAAGPVNVTNIDIDFNETPNVPGCPFGTQHETRCDDIFTLSATLDPITFYVGGQLYKASFRFNDGPGAIVVGGDTIFTAELSPGTAVMFVQGRIDTIPLPGVLALMGMGLVMIGWRVRRRKLA